MFRWNSDLWLSYNYKFFLAFIKCRFQVLDVPFISLKLWHLFIYYGNLQTNLSFLRVNIVSIVFLFLLFFPLILLRLVLSVWSRLILRQWRQNWRNDTRICARATTFRVACYSLPRVPLLRLTWFLFNKNLPADPIYIINYWRHFLFKQSNTATMTEKWSS